MNPESHYSLLKLLQPQEYNFEPHNPIKGCNMRK